MITAEHFVETTDNYAYEFNQILYQVPLFYEMDLLNRFNMMNVFI